MQNLQSPKVPDNFRGKNKIVVQLWYIVWLFLFRPSPHLFNSWRIFLLRSFGAKCSYRAKIRPSAYISYPWNFSCGEHTFIGDQVFIDSLDRVEVGDHVSISNRVYITAGTHDYRSETFDLLIKPVVVQSQSWLAVNSTLLPGAQVGEGTILAACSLLNKTTGVGEIWVGVPAKKTGNR
jgi:putative colanic acid biosynthesis acetyltransferase WcaF